jgi:hypothetical protein
MIERVGGMFATSYLSAFPLGFIWGDEKEVPLSLKLISLRSERSLIPFLFRFIFIILKTII